MNGRDAIGVLIVGWSDAVGPRDPRVTVVQLLAHEAAGVITRGDTVSELNDKARADPLTGLPNRRTWDAEVARASATSRRLTIAILDFDNFKRYNDTRGHQAGDRLLKETASAWRGQLRGGDMLARIGGEELGMLLLECDTEHALEVIERLRETVYGESTCSVGFAERHDGELAELVTARADKALYEAKELGRDRVRMSV
jgi:diguanylate cyclase (GGDEF)-like protein